MKKIFLLALLLGLTGCGNDNQNGASQADSSLGLGGQTVAKTMSASSLALGGWSVTNTSAVGASTLLDGAKDIRVSTAFITPNATDVAKVLRGGVAGIALSIAVDQILGAVDWVLDPDNNQIKYYPKGQGASPPDPTYQWLYYGILYNSAEDACRAFWIRQGSGWTFYAVNQSNPEYPHCSGYNAAQNRYDTNQPIERIRRTEPEKTLPLETIAQKVIDNANDEDTDAQVATDAAAQAILTEAYNDATKAQPIVDQFERNADNKCESGIVNKGSCWVCDKALHYPMTRATRDAKTATRNKGCKNITDPTIKAANATLFRNLINARIAENACWLPPDPNHLDRLREDGIALSHCEN